MDITSYSVGGITILAIITGLVKYAQTLGLASKYAPALAVALGILAGIPIAIQGGMAIGYGIVGGIVAGLLSCGVYDLGKKDTTNTSA